MHTQCHLFKHEPCRSDLQPLLFRYRRSAMMMSVGRKNTLFSRIFFFLLHARPRRPCRIWNNLSCQSGRCDLLTEIVSLHGASRPNSYLVRRARHHVAPAAAAHRDAGRMKFELEIHDSSSSSTKIWRFIVTDAFALGAMVISKGHP